MIKMIKRRRTDNDHGFTLAELLIVVAIIGVLVAVSIPIFSAQLEKSRVGVDLANLRAAKAAAVAAYMLGEFPNQDMEPNPDIEDIDLFIKPGELFCYYDPSSGLLETSFDSCDTGKGTGRLYSDEEERKKAYDTLVAQTGLDYSYDDVTDMCILVHIHPPGDGYSFASDLMLEDYIEVYFTSPANGTKSGVPIPADFDDWFLDGNPEVIEDTEETHEVPEGTGG